MTTPIRYKKAGLKIFLSLIILATGNCYTFAQGKLLEVKLVCHAERGTVLFLLQRISARSGIVIEYAEQYINGGQMAELKEETTTLRNILNNLLAGRKVTIEERNGKIMLIPTSFASTALKQPDEYMLFGYTREEGSLEPLPYAVIMNVASGQVCQSNMFGYYSLRLTRGRHHIKVMHTGYPLQMAEILIVGDTKRSFTLKPTLLPEVNITSGCAPQKDGGSNVDKYLSSIYNNFLGESDPVRSLYLMPGNIESQEMMGQLMVRGGDPGQSTFLLDGNRVFNPTHLLGEISIVSGASLKSIRQFKNDFPTRFDGALSSVTEVNTKDGNMDRWSGELNTGLMAAGVAVEGPLRKGRTAMMASIRRSCDPLFNRKDGNYRARFYDIHFKITHLFGNSDRVTLSGYLGNDHLRIRQTELQYLQAWGNRLATVNWRHVIGSRTFMNTTLNVSNYHNLAGFKLNDVDDTTGAIISSDAYNNYASIERYEAKTQFEVKAFSNTEFRFGGSIVRTIIHPFDTNISQELSEEEESNEPMKPLPFTEVVLYYENEFHPSRRLLVRPGISFSAYRGMDYRHTVLQPRMFAAYNIGRHQQLTFSYARMVQYLHQVTSPALGINSEHWVPSVASLQPAESNMINIGYNFNNGKVVSVAMDLYYKKMNNITSYPGKGNFSYDEDTWPDDITVGKGWSYGAELLAGKKMKKLQLQLSYTLAWSGRQCDDVNDGEKFPFRYDRRHNLNLAVNFQPNRHWNFGAIWHFNTGDWIPRQADDEDDDNPEWPYYDRCTPSYHRLNANVGYYFTTGKLKHKVSTGLYNVLHPNAGLQSGIWNINNNDFNLSDNRLFTPVYYLSYKLNF